jgi:SLAP domain-containing protein
LNVVVVFRNGLDKRLEFTEVPIIIHDRAGEHVAKVHYTLENMKVDANSHKLWMFKVPTSNIVKPVEDARGLTAFIPKATQQKKSAVASPIKNNDLLQ